MLTVDLIDGLAVSRVETSGGMVMRNGVAANVRGNAHLTAAQEVEDEPK